MIDLAKNPRRITVLIPAHNEEVNINICLDALRRQTTVATRIIVIADNCTDRTPELALAAGVEVFETVDNNLKKAGGLNQWLDINLACMSDQELIMVVDADSILEPDFIESALGYIREGYHAVGGVFLGRAGGGLVGCFQRNEYARYKEDVKRRLGQTLVLTGTASIFTVQVLKDVVAGRQDGRLPAPAEGQEPQVYDTKALTEDNELTFAIQHLGYAIIAPVECGLTTEVMETWSDLFRQRIRWKRGAIENCLHYGITIHTAKHWWLQIWGFLGIIVVAFFLITTLISALNGTLRLLPFWVVVTIVFMINRVWTVRKRGPLMMLLAGLVFVEMIYDISLQCVHLRAIYQVLFKSHKEHAW